MRPGTEPPTGILRAFKCAYWRILDWILKTLNRDTHGTLGLDTDGYWVLASPLIPVKSDDVLKLN